MPGAYIGRLYANARSTSIAALHTHTHAHPPTLCTLTTLADHMRAILEPRVRLVRQWERRHHHLGHPHTHHELLNFNKGLAY